ncbi:hypothetical protein RUM44_004594 [Polyplax serrata]|uniref:Uncharacterized protein n=1 Tax=Polyplax serrata TaxID=468196 RepID=A0ABR1B547_POLSC
MGTGLTTCCLVQDICTVLVVRIYLKEVVQSGRKRFQLDVVVKPQRREQQGRSLRVEEGLRGYSSHREWDKTRKLCPRRDRGWEGEVDEKSNLTSRRTTEERRDEMKLANSGRQERQKKPLKVQSLHSDGERHTADLPVGTHRLDVDV